MTVLVPKQDLTGADRAWAARYQAGDVIRHKGAALSTESNPATMGLSGTLKCDKTRSEWI